MNETHITYSLTMVKPSNRTHFWPSKWFGPLTMRERIKMIGAKSKGLMHVVILRFLCLTLNILGISTCQNLSLIGSSVHHGWKSWESLSVFIFPQQFQTILLWESLTKWSNMISPISLGLSLPGVGIQHFKEVFKGWWNKNDYDGTTLSAYHHFQQLGDLSRS